MGAVHGVYCRVSEWDAYVSPYVSTLLCPYIPICLPTSVSGDEEDGNGL